MHNDNNPKLPKENVALRKSLAEEKERLAVILQSICDGVIATDVHGNIVLMNNISEKLTGWTQIDNYPEKQEQSKSTKGLKILIMDDQEIIRDLAQAILGNLGHEIFVAKDGTETIELCKSEIEKGKRFDVIIMDLTIPGGMGGKEAIVKIKEIDPGTKVIVSSGYFDNPVVSDYKRYGFDGFIVKPYKVKELIEVLQNVMA